MGATKLHLEQRRQRLHALADFLKEDVRPILDGAKFFMGVWGETRDNDIPNKIEQTSECGFTGCAIGWGYYCPRLIKAGIRDFIGHNRGKKYDDNFELRRIRYFTTDRPGLMEFFGIDYDEFDYMFTPDDAENLKGKKAIDKVVSRIRKVANNKFDVDKIYL